MSKRKRKPSVRRLATKCPCGKYGYDTAELAMQAIITAEGRAGVRAYTCEQSGRWHTTSKSRLPSHVRGEPEEVPPVGALSVDEARLIVALRAERDLREKRKVIRASEGRHRYGEMMVEKSEAVHKALQAARMPPKG